MDMHSKDLRAAGKYTSPAIHLRLFGFPRTLTEGCHDPSYTVDNFEFLRVIPFQRPRPYSRHAETNPKNSA